MSRQEIQAAFEARVQAEKKQKAAREAAKPLVAPEMMEAMKYVQRENNITWAIGHTEALINAAKPPKATPTIDVVEDWALTLVQDLTEIKTSVDICNRMHRERTAVFIRLTDEED